MVSWKRFIPEQGVAKINFNHLRSLLLRLLKLPEARQLHKKLEVIDGWSTNKYKRIQKQVQCPARNISAPIAEKLRSVSESPICLLSKSSQIDCAVCRFLCSLFFSLRAMSLQFLLTCCLLWVCDCLSVSSSSLYDLGNVADPYAQQSFLEPLRLPEGIRRKLSCHTFVDDKTEPGLVTQTVCDREGLSAKRLPGKIHKLRTKRFCYDLVSPGNVELRLLSGGLKWCA